MGVDAFDSDGLDGRRLEQVLRWVGRAVFVVELELSLGQEADLGLAEVALRFEPLVTTWLMP